VPAPADSGSGRLLHHAHRCCRGLATGNTHR
jgi:hypothetical protein